MYDNIHSVLNLYAVAHEKEIGKAETHPNEHWSMSYKTRANGAHVAPIKIYRLELALEEINRDVCFIRA